MKIAKKSLLSIALALLMLTACLATFGAVSVQNAFADGGAAAGGGDESPATPPSDKSGELCYFSDTDPLIDDVSLNKKFPNYSLDYIHYDITPELFTQMVNGEQFNFIKTGGYDVLIFEIRTFKPDPADLQQLFSWLNESNIKIIFVSNYELFEYSNTHFMDNVFAYYKCANTTRLYTYVRNSVKHMSNHFDPFDSLCLLIDGRFVDCADWDGEDILTLCERSEYLCYLLQHLCMQYLNNYTDVYNYREIVRLLHNAGVSLVVNISENKYIDILTGTEEKTLDNLNDIGSKIGDVSVLNIAAMGMWRLESNYYNFLHHIQYKDDLEIPVYILEIEPIEYDPDGLKVIPDSELFGSYGEEGENDFNDFLAFLDGIL